MEYIYTKSYVVAFFLGFLFFKADINASSFINAVKSTCVKRQGDIELGGKYMAFSAAFSYGSAKSFKDGINMANRAIRSEYNKPQNLGITFCDELKPENINFKDFVKKCLERDLGRAVSSKEVFCHILDQAYFKSNSALGVGVLLMGISLFFAKKAFSNIKSVGAEIRSNF